MTKEHIYEDLTVVRKRSRNVFLILSAALFLALGYYWKTQIFDFKKYWKLAEANRLHVQYLMAPRGVIKDRSNVILADNTAGFRASIIRENIKDRKASCRNVARLLGLDENDLTARLEKFKDLPRSEPIVVKDNLTPEEIARIESRKSEFPELSVDVESKRSYPFGSLGAHVLGYLQELTPEDIKKKESGKGRRGNMAGRTGIERQYDGQLTGEDGQLIEVVDSLGRSQGDVTRKEPVRGKDILLTLDYELQKTAEDLLIDKEGAIVMMDPRDGSILALASSPNFDPNGFISRFTPEEWNKLIQDPDHPLENRVVRGLYPPGSIFKIPMALAGLETGLIDENTTVHCSGSTVIYDYPRNCWFKAGHGSMNLANAIKNSCNIYFYNLGRRMGIETISRYASGLGLGEKTGIDIPGEKNGLVPDPVWKEKTFHAKWFAGETISIAIGQGALLVTPIQIARMISCVANRGFLVTPRLLADGGAGEKKATSIRRESFEKVIEGMWRSVNDEGTGMGARVPGFDICGKTGSTQWISREKKEMLERMGKSVKKTHSWFAGFAPRFSPRIVVTVLVEFGGGGGATAAPIAKELFEAYKKKYD